MGIISRVNTDNLFWLGRYTERVYTTIRLFGLSFDSMIEDGTNYHDFCRELEIPDVYLDHEDFVHRYCYDRSNPDSICSNLYRAYDNAIVLREELGSETFAFIQMCIYEMDKAIDSQSPMVGLMKITDLILAFWGIADDYIADENVRSLIKAGKRIERIDLYCRIHNHKQDIIREYNRLRGRLRKTNLCYDQKKLDHIGNLLESADVDFHEVLLDIESLVS